MQVKSIIYRLLWGRPMRRIGFLFTDAVSGESVNLYVDSLGRHWMATSAMALFRVPHGGAK